MIAERFTRRKNGSETKDKKMYGFQVKEKCLSLFIVSYDMGVDKMLKVSVQ